MAEFNLFGADAVRNMQRGGQQVWEDTGANIKAMRDQFTNARAGGAYARGDRQGAAAMLAQGGNIDGARVIQGDLRTEQRQTMQDEQAAEQKTYDRDRTAKDDELKAIDFRVKVLKGVGDTLLKIPEGQGRAPKLREAIELFRYAGYPEDMIGRLSQMDESALSTAAIRGIVGEADAAYKQFMQTSEGNVVGIRSTGQVDTLYQGAPKRDIRERSNADGSTEFFDVNASLPPPAPASRPQRPIGDPDAVVAPFLSDGARVTSGVRTPEKNAAVGGVNNSYHLQSNGGSARDLVPPQGVSMSQFHRRVQEGLPPGWQAINEGDHIHIEPGSYQVAQAGGNTPRPGTIRGDAAPRQAALPAGSGLTDLGGGFYRDRVGRMYQRNGSGVMQQTAGVTDEAVKTTARNVSGLNTILQSVDEYDRATRAMSRKDFGPSGKYVGDPAKFATAQTAATNLIMLAKSPEFYNLGVITGPDLAILESVVQNPGKFATYFLENKIQPSLRQLAVMIGQKYRGELAAFRTQGGDPAGLDPIWQPAKRPTPPAGAAGNRPPAAPAASRTKSGASVSDW